MRHTSASKWIFALTEVFEELSMVAFRVSVWVGIGRHQLKVVLNKLGTLVATVLSVSTQQGA